MLRLCAVVSVRHTRVLAAMYFLMAGHGTPGDATRRGESRVGHGLAGLTRSKGRTRVVPSILILDDAFLEPYPRYSIWFSDEHRSPYQQIVHPLPRWHHLADFTMTHRYWIAEPMDWQAPLDESDHLSGCD